MAISAEEVRHKLDSVRAGLQRADWQAASICEAVETALQRDTTVVERLNLYDRLDAATYSGHDRVQWPVQPEEPAHPVQSFEPVRHVRKVRPVQPEEPVRPVQSFEPVQSAHGGGSPSWVPAWALSFVVVAMSVAGSVRPA